MSNNKSTNKPSKTVTFDPLTRTSSGSEYPSKEITDHHKANPRQGNHHRLDPKGKLMTFFGLSKSTSRYPNKQEESNTALWQTPYERELAKRRIAFLHQRASIIKKILKKREEREEILLVLKQMKEAKIEDPKFEEDINNLTEEITATEGEVAILNENIEDIEKQMSNIANEDNIIIEERHKHHQSDNDWIKSVIKKLPKRDEQYIKKRYNELTNIMGGVKKKSKKRMVQRKSKTRKVIKTKLKKTNKKYR